MAVDFLVQAAGDTVGLAVAEGLREGQALTGLVVEEDRPVTIEARRDIPVGHRLAVRAMAAGDAVTWLGAEIGRARAAIAPGDLVDGTNAKLARPG